MNDKLPKYKKQAMLKSLRYPNRKLDLINTEDGAQLVQPISAIDPHNKLIKYEIEPIEHKIVEMPILQPTKGKIEYPDRERDIMFFDFRKQEPDDTLFKRDLQKLFKF